MNIGRHKNRKQTCQEHRQERYLHAIGQVIDGKALPGYATLRWEKLKTVKGG